MIRTALEKKGWTQAKLAQIMAVETPVLNDYVIGKRSGISARQVLRIAIPLGLDPHELAHAFVDQSIDVEMKKLLDNIKVRTANDKEDEK